MDAEDHVYDAIFGAAAAPSSVYSNNIMNQNIGVDVDGMGSSSSTSSPTQSVGSPNEATGPEEAVNQSTPVHPRASATFNVTPGPMAGGLSGPQGMTPGYGYITLPDGSAQPFTPFFMDPRAGPEAFRSMARSGYGGEESRRLREEAAACIPDFDGTQKISVERWIRIFRSTVLRLQMGDDDAVLVFFRKVSKIPQWTSDRLLKDAKKNEKPGLAKWLNRLYQSFAVPKSTRMAAVRNRKQKEDEIPEQFVTDVVRMAREADPHIDDDDIVSIIRQNVHSKYKSVFAICSVGAHTPKQAMESLSSAMSTEMSDWRDAFPSMVKPAASSTTASALLVSNNTASGRSDGEGGKKRNGFAGGPSTSHTSGRDSGADSSYTNRGPHNGQSANGSASAGGKWQRTGQRRGSAPYAQVSGVGPDLRNQITGRTGTGSAVCFQCNLPGHLRRNCPSLIEFKRQQQQLPPSSQAPQGFGYLTPSFPAPPPMPSMAMMPQSVGFPMFYGHQSMLSHGPPSPTSSSVSRASRTTRTTVQKND